MKTHRDFQNLLNRNFTESIAECEAFSKDIFQRKAQVMKDFDHEARWTFEATNVVGEKTNV
jgi:hypothetical protein